MTARFAIYAVPGIATDVGAEARLRDRAESWLGRALAGSTPDPALPPGWTRQGIDAITVDARRYGFHGTLTAPFRLADDRSLPQLESDLGRFAATAAPVELPELTLSSIGAFFALVPGSDAPALHELARDLVTGFDVFRAPASAAEIARRNPESLTPRQRRMLETWGYPYVFDEFRFHLTLTDRIAPERQAIVRDTLSAWFADSLGESIVIDAIAILVEPEAGAEFRLHSVHPLRRGAEPRASDHATDHERAR